jgi:hypothetical protein
MIYIYGKNFRGYEKKKIRFNAGFRLTGMQMHAQEIQNDEALRRLEKKIDDLTHEFDILKNLATIFYGSMSR